MKVVAFVGPSGTGKSHRAQVVAREHHIDYIIDDAILIHDNRVIAGTSAKKAETRIDFRLRFFIIIDVCSFERA